MLDIPLQIYVLQLLLAHAAYAFDRLRDVLDGEHKDRELYNYIQANQLQVQVTATLATIASMAMIAFNEETRLLALPLLLVIAHYRDIKPFLGPLKPFFIGFFTILAAVVTPSVMLEHNWSVLSDYPVMLAPMLSTVSMSTLGDVPDMEEDIARRIFTVPTLLGKDRAQAFSNVCAVTGLALHATHPNAALHVQDALYQGAIISGNIIQSDEGLFKERLRALKTGANGVGGNIVKFINTLTTIKI
jgi:4-hydroxybenzoate polyprenyltransferase